jgi:hypothetical protein
VRDNPTHGAAFEALLSARDAGCRTGFRVSAPLSTTATPIPSGVIHTWRANARLPITPRLTFMKVCPYEKQLSKVR